MNLLPKIWKNILVKIMLILPFKFVSFNYRPFRPYCQLKKCVSVNYVKSRPEARAVNLWHVKVVKPYPSFLPLYL